MNCDTFVILAPYTRNGKTLFAKNSDRDPDETQNVVFIPRMKHSADEVVKSTYIEIPQVEETFDVILSQPFWMWGGEIGVNQFGVTIGNEAVFTTEKKNDVGLLGMDMIRLALERTKSAKDALNYIIELLEKYGQGGGCGYHDRSFKYDNSWIIADTDTAYVLETAGKHWVWKQIEKNYSISNVLTIEKKYDSISEEAIKNAIKKGRCSSENDFSFKKCYSSRGLNMNTIKLNAGKGAVRRLVHYTRSCALADSKTSDVKNLINILRAHQPLENGNHYAPEKGSNGDVCWHAATNLFRPTQSTSSFVTEIDKEFTSIWATCGSAPCIQLFRPLFLFRNNPNSIPSEIKPGKEYYDENSIWWINEKLHRTILQDYIGRTQLYFSERDEVENQWIDQVRTIISDNSGNISTLKEKLMDLSVQDFNKADELVKKWTELTGKNPINRKVKKSYLKYWDKMNKENNLLI